MDIIGTSSIFSISNRRMSRRPFVRLWSMKLFRITKAGDHWKTVSHATRVLTQPWPLTKTIIKNAEWGQATFFLKIHNYSLYHFAEEQQRDEELSQENIDVVRRCTALFQIWWFRWDTRVLTRCRFGYWNTLIPFPVLQSSFNFYQFDLSFAR